jgi:hypothetical protein
LLPTLGERAYEANPSEAIKWGQSTREFCLPATPWAHWSMAFAYYLLMSSAFPL